MSTAPSWQLGLWGTSSTRRIAVSASFASPEPVIGYISAGSVSQMRIYIDNRNIPGAISKPPVSVDQCYVGAFYYRDQEGINDIPIWIYSGKQFVTQTIPRNVMPGQHIIGYEATDRFCADCTLRGSNKPPSFWVSN